jgi:multidrug efflux system membrane fusion protein
MSRILKVLLPLIVLATGALAAKLLIDSRAEPETRIPVVLPPLVNVLPVALEDVELTVTSQGTVSPRTEGVLVPEVSGRVTEISPSLISGGFFEAGELLLRIDSDDYKQALVQTKASVTQAELRLALEEAEAEVALEEWEQLGDEDASPLTLRVPQVADAKAAVAAAKATVERAERDLRRTEVRAPYAGRVRNKSVDLGQFVVRGNPVATIYAVDYAEVRLPLPDDQLAFIDLPLDYRGGRSARSRLRVILRADFAGQVHEWDGTIVRTEGEIDPRSRMVHAVAQVKDPYGSAGRGDRPPLAAGLFVEAEILGRRAEGIAIIPRSALRERNQVLIVDDDERLRFREVQVLRNKHNQVYLSSGLAEGERVVVTPLASVSDGMRVRVAERRTAP